MAFNVEQYKQRILEFIKELSKTRRDDTLLISKELLALIRLRVQNKGEKFNGSLFGRYSQAVVPNWYFDKRHNSTGAKNRLKKKGYFVSYVDFRQANNLQTNYVDLTVSGKMWREAGAVVRSDTESRTVIQIGGTTNYSDRVIDYNSQRYGNILLPSDKEIDMVEKANFERVLKRLINFLK